MGRAGRAAVFAAAGVLLAAVAHVLASGTPVPGWGLAAGLGGAGLLGWLTAGRERGPLPVTGLTVGVQAVLHALFSLGGDAAPAPGGLAAQWAQLLCGTGPVSEQRAAQLAEAAGLAPADGFAVVPLDDAPGPVGLAQHAMVLAGHQHGGGAGGFGMLGAHLLAALLLGLWLAAGERAVHGLARAVAARLFAPVLLVLGAVRPPHPPRGRRPRAGHLRPSARLLVHSLATRGPPARSAAA
ncbi:hypothetical protein ACIQBJ_04755 [Kitasatospora sp. NPDC088391]|uniref:hypothetical protein n=1 Tax=Kitasatospora sp. NPDC088391 TaxID=3364074 RepID=UPI00380DAB2A